MINQIISIFLPSIIALKTHYKLEKSKEEIKDRIEKYLIYVMIINVISYAIIIYLFKQPNITFTYVFTIKYIILSSVIAVIVPVVEKFILSNMGLEIKVEKNEEKN